jgi:hypothetical protein
LCLWKKTLAGFREVSTLYSAPVYGKYHIFPGDLIIHPTYNIMFNVISADILPIIVQAKGISVNVNVDQEIHEEIFLAAFNVLNR